MIVIEDGVVAQAGPPAEVTARPRSRYVADLTGVTLLRGTAAGAAVELDGGGVLTGAGPARGPVLAAIPPAAVTVSRAAPDPLPANAWRGTVGAVDLLGDRVRVRVDGTPAVTAEVAPQLVDELALDDGGELWACVDPSRIALYPP
jgi:molybdate transport system ATP-binding protein